MPTITPFLWFADRLDEAVAFYLSVFRNAKLIRRSGFGDDGPATTGAVLSATFELEGQTFHALQAGPQFKFTEAVSFYIDCKGQDEVDYYWERLSAGGEEQACGWLKDRYGLSWQVIPEALPRLINDPDPKKAAAAMQAMLQMRKIDVAALERAHGAA